MTKQINTIHGYFKSVMSLRKKWADNGLKRPSEIWFRGVSNHREHHLVPSAHYHQDCDEVSMFFEFCQRAPAYMLRPPGDEWEWYFLMRHHGLPTRLLDWTENPLAALWFSLNQIPKGQDINPGVWVIDPCDLNQVSCRHLDLIIPGGEWSKHWLPSSLTNRSPGDEFRHDEPDGTSRTYSLDFPIAVYPKRAEPRINAQQGVFTLHGLLSKPIDEFLQSRESTDCLGRKARIRLIEIDPGCIDDLRDKLFGLGVGKSSLFPDLDSLVGDIKHRWGITDVKPSELVKEQSPLATLEAKKPVAKEQSESIGNAKSRTRRK